MEIWIQLTLLLCTALLYFGAIAFAMVKIAGGVKFNNGVKIKCISPASFFSDDFSGDLSKWDEFLYFNKSDASGRVSIVSGELDYLRDIESLPLEGLADTAFTNTDGKIECDVRYRAVANKFVITGCWYGADWDVGNDFDKGIMLTLATWNDGTVFLSLREGNGGTASVALDDSADIIGDLTDGDQYHLVLDWHISGANVVVAGEIFNGAVSITTVGGTYTTATQILTSNHGTFQQSTDNTYRPRVDNYEAYNE